MKRCVYSLWLVSLMGLMLSGLSSACAEDSQKSAKDSKQGASMDAEAKHAVDAAFSKLAEMDKKWKSERASSGASEKIKSSSASAGRKSDYSSSCSSGSCARGDTSGAYYSSTSDSSSSRRRSIVSNGSYAVPEGGWVEIGGVGRGTSYSSSSGPSYVREGSVGRSSISVRATVIRLDGPED